MKPESQQHCRFAFICVIRGQFAPFLRVSVAPWCIGGAAHRFRPFIDRFRTVFPPSMDRFSPFLPFIWKPHMKINGTRLFPPPRELKWSKINWPMQESDSS